MLASSTLYRRQREWYDRRPRRFWKRSVRTNASWDNMMDVNHSVVNQLKENPTVTLPLAFFLLTVCFSLPSLITISSQWMFPELPSCVNGKASKYLFENGEYGNIYESIKIFSSVNLVLVICKLNLNAAKSLTKALWSRTPVRNKKIYSEDK